jgi:hypothetical protein
MTSGAPDFSDGALVNPNRGCAFKPDKGKYYSFAVTEIEVIRGLPLPAAWLKTVKNPRRRIFVAAIAPGPQALEPDDDVPF